MGGVSVLGTGIVYILCYECMLCFVCYVITIEAMAFFLLVASVAATWLHRLRLHLRAMGND